MSLVLTRVDDRLIHGQVVEGWLRVIQATRIVVASDEVADDPLQVNLMSLAVPSDVKVMVLKVQAAADSLKAGSWAKERVLLLLPGLREARRLAAAGVELEALNLGGLHPGPGGHRVPAFARRRDRDARPAERRAPAGEGRAGPRRRPRQGREAPIGRTWWK
jgi:mannose/fructose/N-acetylgalactosamine-specific phosphotransferase system component IIB